MESIDVYKSSYNYIRTLQKAVTTNNVSIDFSKLDETSASVIRLALSRAIGDRYRETWKVICNANPDSIAKL